MSGNKKKSIKKPKSKPDPKPSPKPTQKQKQTPVPELDEAEINNVLMSIGKKTKNPDV